MADNNPDSELEVGSLETPAAGVVEPTAASPQAGTSPSGTPPAAPAPSPDIPSQKPGFRRRFLAHINIYSLLFVLLLLIAAGVITITLSGNSGNNPKNPKVSSLTDSQITALKGATTVVGDTKQTLDVQSNSIFEGQVLVRGDLSVAGDIKFGGTLNLPSITVGGLSNLNQAKVSNDLGVGGNLDVQGQASFHKGLSVSGATTFGNLSAAQLNVTSLQLNGDLGINRHIVTSGALPAKSSGGALGGGGTATVNGNDTAGTININTGSSPAAGLFINVTFAHAFAAAPHVIITPIGSAAGGIPYYVNRTATGFSVGTTSAAPASSSFAFDYFIVQ